MSLFKKEFSFTNRWVSYSISTVIIIIILLIALPNFIPGQDHCGIGWSTPANMHTVQTLVETYAVDHNGIFPDSFKTLEKEAMKEPNAYWKDFKNPFIVSSGFGQAYTDEGQKTQAGIVTYQPIGTPPKSYKIFGYDKDNQKIQRKNKVYYLTNN